MNIIKTFLVLIFTTFFFSCQNGYEQEYKTFEEFNQKNERNKAWFPKIINSDATELKNISYLDSLCAFGKFKYRNSEIYDSIFSINPKVNFDLFNEKVNRNKKQKPTWFLEIKDLNKTNIELIQQGRFYILKNNTDKSIYFILSN
jgi:hypothetical protein